MSHFFPTKKITTKSRRLESVGLSNEGVGVNLEPYLIEVEDKYKKSKRKGSQNHTGKVNNTNNSLSINNNNVTKKSLIDNCKRNIVNNQSNYYDIFGMRRSVNEGVLFRALEKVYSKKNHPEIN
jgi:hypothetical protein